MPRLSLPTLASFVAVTSLGTQSRPARSADVQAFVAVDAPVVALTHVRVIDGTGSPARDDQTVILRGSRIESVGPAATLRPPRGARVIDGSGHSVIPGLIGMHDHTLYTTEKRVVQSNYTAPRMYLAAGVTTIRTTGALEPYAELHLKKKIDDGQVPGPHLVVTGPYLTGPADETADGMSRLDNAAEARRVVAYWAEEGVT